MSIEVRRTAIDPAASFLVQAPAGSGKTELLTRRILRLLAVVDEPEEILALTFTRKAAAEMRGRVVEALTMERPVDETSHRMETWELACAANRRSEERGWHLAEHPARLNMMTLDSLTHALARQLPLLSGLGDMPTPSTHVAPLYRQAAEVAFAQLERHDREQAAAVLLHQDHDLPALIQLVADMLGRRDQWLHDIRRHADHAHALRDMLERGLAGIMAERLAACACLIPEGAKAELPALIAFAAANRGDHALCDLQAWPEEGLSALPLWQAIAGELMTDKGMRKPGGINVKRGFPADKALAAQKQRFQQWLEQLASVDGLEAALAELMSMPAEPHFSDAQWRVLQSQLVLLLKADTALKRLFTQRGEADFIEIALRAMQALEDADGNPTDLLMRLDYRIHHILVDEFQDTSLLQLRLLRNLTEGWQAGDGTHRTLFMVGDPMQSIYRFRKAEVGLFLLAASNRALLPPVTALNLTRNFRSAPAIVDWVNRAFAHIFPSQSDPLMGAIEYAGAHAALTHPGEVHLYLQPQKDADGEAAAVVATIRRALETAGARIAVLGHTRRHLHAIMQALAEADIAFRAVDILPLNARPEIRLLRAMMRALLHPADRESWAALLRSPCCGLTTADLHALLAGDERTVIEILGDGESLAGLDADAQRRTARLWQAMAPCLGIAGRLPVRELLETAWHRAGMPGLIGSDAGSNVAAMLDLVDEIDQGGRVDFALLDERLERLFSAPDSSPAAARVELLTMHGAKGLQWDVVILPGLGYGRAKSDAPLLAMTDVPLATGVQSLMAMRPPRRGKDAAFAMLQNVEKVRESNELSRLLYVACTRSESELHMFGHVSEASGEAMKGSLLGLLLGDGMGEDCFGATVHAMQTVGAASIHERRPLTRVADPGAAPAWPPAMEEVESEYFWAGPEAAPVGTAVHAALQHIGERGIEAWNEADSASEVARMRRMLIGEGLSGAALARAVERCDAALTRVLASTRAAWLLSGRHDEAHAEWALSSTQNGMVSHHVIDRSFVDADGVRWIVDYKTGEHGGGDVDAFLAAEMRRHRPQLERYAGLLGGMEGRPLRLGLYFPMIDAWHELTPGEDAG
jgi:ATP-dependent exoDNAse (exonuclease V) beta subunit